jgi:general secretion pathway protein N
MAAGEVMKAIVPLGLAASLAWAAAAIAQEPETASTAFGLLEGTVGHPHLAAVPPTARVPSAPPAQEGAAATPLAAIPLDSLRATRERPVFSESRRPPAVVVAAPVHAFEPPVPAEPSEPDSLALTLIGTAVGSEETVAILLDSASRHVIELRIGEAESGWTLRSVTPKTTTFEKDDREVTLSMPKPGAPSASGDEAPVGADAFGQPFDAFVQRPFDGPPKDGEVSRKRRPEPPASRSSGRAAPRRAHPAR